MEASKTSVKSYDYDEYFIRGLAGILDIIERRVKCDDAVDIMHQVRLQEQSNRLEEITAKANEYRFPVYDTVRNIDEFDSWIMVGFRRLLRLLDERFGNQPLMKPEARHQIKDLAWKLILRINDMEK